MADIVLINNLMQANALSLNYYSNAQLINQQDFLVPFVRQKNINNNKIYYGEVSAKLPTNQFNALNTIMDDVRINALDAKQFPAKKVNKQAAAFGSQSDAIIACAKSMYNTIVTMLNNPNYSVSETEFENLLQVVYDESKNIPQESEANLLLKEFTRAEAGIRSILMLQDPPYDTKLQKIGARLGEYNVICSTTSTQQQIFMLLADAFYLLMFKNLSAQQQDKLQFILCKNYGQKDGAEIFTDIQKISANINKVPTIVVNKTINYAFAAHGIFKETDITTKSSDKKKKYRL